MLTYLKALLNSGSTFAIDLNVHWDNVPDAGLVLSRLQVGVLAVDEHGIVIEAVDDHIDAVCVPWSNVVTIRVCIGEDKRNG